MIRLVLILLMLLASVRPVQAIYDPTSVPNNKFGIHVADLNDIPDTAPLVNSNGGDWGYVTVVLSDADRDQGRWQQLFNQMRRLRLIPIIRIATHVENSNWVIPNKDRLTELVQFLNKLNWPVENRYIALYNEPNHAKEWGGKLDPEGYADVMVTAAKLFKEASADFFILPAGLDVSAVSDGAAMDAAEYMRRMFAARPEMLGLIDGWNSHSYPNPGFSGSPNASGRGTVKSYEWELTQLAQKGLTKKLPVFITETGWQHSQGKVTIGGLSPEAVGEYMKIAATGAWNDPRVAAITPFVFSYQDVPFDHFSFKKLGNGEYYPHYQAYKELPKTKAQPKKRERYEPVEALLPKTLIVSSTYSLTGVIRNEGQGILSEADNYSLVLTGESNDFQLFADPVPTLEPGEKGKITLRVKTPEKAGKYKVQLAIKHNDSTFEIENGEIEVIPPLSVKVLAQLGWQTSNNANDVTVLVYKEDELLHKFTGLELKEGVVIAWGLINVVPGQPYRIVTLIPYYLPRQSIVTLEIGETPVSPERFLPIDFDNDGALTVKDFPALMNTQPNTFMVRLFGK